MNKKIAFLAKYLKSMGFKKESQSLYSELKKLSSERFGPKYSKALSEAIMHCDQKIEKATEDINQYIESENLILKKDTDQEAEESVQEEKDGYSYKEIYDKVFSKIKDNIDTFLPKDEFLFNVEELLSENILKLVKETYPNLEKILLTVRYVVETEDQHPGWSYHNSSLENETTLNIGNFVFNVPTWISIITNPFGKEGQVNAVRTFDLKFAYKFFVHEISHNIQGIFEQNKDKEISGFGFPTKEKKLSNPVNDPKEKERVERVKNMMLESEGVIEKIKKDSGYIVLAISNWRNVGELDNPDFKDKKEELIAFTSLVQKQELEDNPSEEIFDVNKPSSFECAMFLSKVEGLEEKYKEKARDFFSKDFTEFVVNNMEEMQEKRKMYATKKKDKSHVNYNFSTENYIIGIDAEGRLKAHPRITRKEMSEQEIQNLKDLKEFFTRQVSGSQNDNRIDHYHRPIEFFTNLSDSLFGSTSEIFEKYNQTKNAKLKIKNIQNTENLSAEDIAVILDITAMSSLGNIARDSGSTVTDMFQDIKKINSMVKEGLKKPNKQFKALFINAIIRLFYILDCDPMNSIISKNNELFFHNNDFAKEFLDKYNKEAKKLIEKRFKHVMSTATKVANAIYDDVVGKEMDEDMIKFIEDSIKK